MTLLDRIIAAEGPDRALFEEVFDLLHPAPRAEDEPPWQGAGTLMEPLYHEWRVAGGKFKAMLDAEAWTSAAEMLVPEGCLHMARTVWESADAPLGRTVGYASIDRYFRGEQGLMWKENFLAIAATPALALLAAILRAERKDDE